MVLKSFSSINSSASSTIKTFNAGIDFNFAVWFPLLVLIPENIISLLVTLWLINEFAILNSSPTPSKSIFSRNSGTTDILADESVYRV